LVVVAIVVVGKDDADVVVIAVEIDVMVAG